VASFTLEREGQSDGGLSFQIEGASAAPVEPGVRFTPEAVVYHPDLGVSRTPAGGDERMRWRILFNAAESRYSEDAGVVLDYRFAPSTGQDDARVSQKQEVLLEVRSSQQTLRYRYLPRVGDRRLVLPGALFSGQPYELLVEAPGDGFALSAARLAERPVEEEDGSPREEDQPIPAELGTVLAEYPREAWRFADFELFAWSAYPQVLIMDTESYAVQSRFFKRLAFFVEKQGYAGRLLSDSELAGRHGWNAHNYHARDLARFFERAAEQDVELNAYEQRLRELLLHAGVIRETDEGYAAGRGERGERGGIVSLSRESYPLLRELLLTHEALHGLYYAVPEYREAADRVWRQLTERERSFWRTILGGMTYDPDNEYLMRNEFQAYLMQQPLAQVRGYVHGSLADRVMRIVPSQADEIRRFLERHPQSVMDAARAMQDALIRHTGARAGDIVSLHRRSN
jgi:hypothetical protein